MGAELKKIKRFFKKNKSFLKSKKEKVLTAVIEYLIEMLPFEIDKVSNLDKEDSIIKDKEESPLDLEPLCSFMKEYVGETIVTISGIGNYNDSLKGATPSVIIDVFLEENNIKFKIIKLNGARLGHLILHPSKYGMFSEKVTEAEESPGTIYRVSFLNGYSLEYSDSEELGIIKYEEI